MKTRKIYLLLICFLIICNGFSQTTYSTKASNNKTKKNQISSQNKSTAPVTIFYGLNESHSNNWAQCTKDGLVGISYFKLDNNQTNYEGSLIYKTIQPNNTEAEEVVTTGSRLEISVLLFDTSSKPHIFAASSDTNDQVIVHYFKNTNNQWESDTIIHFLNEGGKHIYELSADMGPNNSFHLLVLKTPSNPDSDDYYYAFANAHLYHLTNAGGSWQKELINNYNTIWTLDEYSKALNRQDIKVDNNGFVHIVFGEQINAMSSFSPSRLCYATNKSGSWIIETAVNYQTGTRDDGGWYPSLCLDTNGIPNISCTYFGRVSSGSAMYAKLLFITRISNGTWNQEILATTDDGYYGTDGRNYTGGLTHLVFDKNNTPHIIFSDIASSHAGMNYLNLGNIRYAVKYNNTWNISTVYSQPLPNGFFNATEMYGMCLLISDNINKIQVIGQKLVVNSSTNYNFSLVHKIINNGSAKVESLSELTLFHNYPNPFNSETTIEFSLPSTTNVKILILDISGEIVDILIDEKLKQGCHSIIFNANNINSGIYFCKIITPEKEYINKMINLK